MAKINAKAQADMQTQQAKIQGEIGKMNADTERDLTLEQTQSQNRLIEIARELESSIAEIQAGMSADIAIEGAQAQMDVASDDNSHDNKMDEIRLQNAGRSQNENNAV
jgi:hypothetical protein